jgi:hypothetical protein
MIATSLYREGIACTLERRTVMTGQSNTQNRGNQSCSSGSASQGDFNKGTCPSNIRERMDVIASCGTKVGVVDHVEGNAIKLTKNDSKDHQHHFIPTEWVERVDSSVHLKKNSMDTERNWKSEAAGCGSCG